jgi:hypothetical protein
LRVVRYRVDGNRTLRVLFFVGAFQVGCQIIVARWPASWFETRGVAALLTMRVIAPHPDGMPKKHATK